MKLEFKFNGVQYTNISSSGSFLRAFFAIHWNAASTLNPSFADVSKYGMFPFEAHHAFAFFSETYNTKKKKKRKHFLEVYLP